MSMVETTKHNLCPETLRNMSPQSEVRFYRSKWKGGTAWQLFPHPRRDCL